LNGNAIGKREAGAIRRFNVKWIILCLVLINATFFGWQLSRDQEVVASGETPPATTSAAMVNRLLLVSEVESSVLRQRRDLLPRQAVATPRSPVRIPESHNDAASVSLGEVLAMPPDADRECYTVGPLENEDDISALSAWFNAQDSQATLRNDERRETVSTWVFMAPLESREAADARVVEMQAANIEDIYVIPRGDMANAISLGLYSQNDTLQRRVTELEERGFTPSVLPRYRTVTASWFDVAASAARPMTVAVLDQIFPDLIIRKVACGNAPIAGDSTISYNSTDPRRQDGYSDNASGAAVDATGRSGTQ
jgi:hypothetical protein